MIKETTYVFLIPNITIVIPRILKIPGNNALHKAPFARNGSRSRSAPYSPCRMERWEWVSNHSLFSLTKISVRRTIMGSPSPIRSLDS